jgi:DnaA family protein
LRDDLRTRLGWGLVYQVHGLSDEEKALALSQHAQAKGFVLPPEVTQYLLRHGRRDLPSLMAVLDALDAHSLRLHRAPSVPILKEVMQQESGLEGASKNSEFAQKQGEEEGQAGKPLSGGSQKISPRRI